MSDIVLSAESLTKTFHGRKRWLFGRPPVIHAVSNVDLRLHEGETVGVVGESGSGKTTLARLLLQLEWPTSGTVRFRGRAVDELAPPGVREFRQTVQAVFQDPYSSLSPRMRIGEIVAEPLVVSRQLAGTDVLRRVAEALERVGLEAGSAQRYPHELSGGQRQRVAIARALASSPKAIILDEPVSSLDVSIRVQILNLLRELQAQSGLAYLFISHDLSSVRYLCRRVMVMYLGRVIEEGPAAAVLARPKHPYTQLLRMAAIPRWKGRGDQNPLFQADEAGDTLNLPSGCAFHPRCPYSAPVCIRERPVARELGPGRYMACHGYEEPLHEADARHAGDAGVSNRSPLLE